MNHRYLLYEILKNIAGKGLPEDREAAVTVLRREIESALNQDIRPDSPEYKLALLTMGILKMMGPPFDSALAGLRQKGGGFFGAVTKIITAITLIGIPIGNIVLYGGADTPAAPTPLEEFGRYGSGIAVAATSALVPPSIQGMASTFDDAIRSITGMPPDILYAGGLGPYLLYAPDRDAAASVAAQIQELHKEKGIVDISLIGAQANTTAAAAALTSCATGFGVSTIGNASAACTEAEQIAGSSLKALMQPILIRDAVSALVEEATAAAEAAQESLFERVGTVTASLVAPSNTAANTPALPAPPTNSTRVVSSLEATGLFGILTERAKKVASTAVESVSGATASLVKATQTAASSALVESKQKASERAYQSGRADLYKKSLPLIISLSERPILYHPVQFALRAQALLNATGDIPYPSEVALFDLMRTAITEIAYPTAAAFQRRVSGNMRSNGNLGKLHPRLQALVNMIAVSSPQLVASQQLGDQIAALEASAVYRQERAFNENIKAFETAAGARTDMAPYKQKYAALFRIMRSAPRPSSLTELMDAIVASEAARAGMISLKELIGNASAAKLPLNIKLVRIFWLTVFQYVVFFGTPSMLGILVFYLFGGFYTLAVQGVGGIGRQTGRIVTSGVDMIVALTDIAVAASRLARAKIEAQMPPPRPALTNGQRGGGRRKTRRRRGKAKKARKSRRHGTRK